MNFGHFFNFLKTLQEQTLNTFESFSSNPDVILGLFEPFWTSWKIFQKWRKRKGLPLTILDNFGHFLNFLKTLRKQRLNTFESFWSTPDVILGLFEPFWTTWKIAQKWPKSKGLPLTILVNFGHFFNFLKTLLKQRVNLFELFSTTPDVILSLFERFWTSWKKGQKWPKSKG